MPNSYGRDLDLNLLRVFAVVVESGSVTEAAKRLYLTQPGVSAALRRLRTAVGAPLFARSGRNLVLSSRGRRLAESLHPHLERLVEAALAPASFEPYASERTFRLGLSDSAEQWMLPHLLQMLAIEAPRVRVIAVPVQFRTVGAALTSGLDAAITVADELPATVRRENLVTGGFVCLYDARRMRLRKLGEAEYFAHDHVIVSYNGDLRGIVEDQLRKVRRVRCSVSSFANLGAVIDGTRMLATVPRFVADEIRMTRPHLKTLPLPFTIEGSYWELLWTVATDDDEACQFLRDRIRTIARSLPFRSERRARTAPARRRSA